jgi:exonuclease SbcC
MTPERLVLNEFGPYTEPQTVDFETLGARQLFLIHGPTGSGKSTLLDAICFALYGETSGNERGGDEMRSDFADPDEPTEVTLDFQLGDDRYRLRRRPRQTLAKKRGTGTTEKSQQATLYDRSDAEAVTDDGTPMADGMRDVNGQVEALLGLECEQFRQVVVLPQGKFRQFLSAGSSKREDILKVLFDTGRYEQLEETLKTMADEAEETVRRLRDRKARTLEEFEVEDVEGLEEKKSEVAQALSDATEQKETLEERLDEAREALEEAKADQEALDELADARETVEQLRANKEEHEERTTRLASARRAAEIGPLKDDLETRQSEKDDAARAAADAAAALRTAQEEREAAQAQLRDERARDDRREALRTEQRRLADAEEDIETLESVREQLDDTRAEQEALTETLQAAKETKADLEATLDEARTELEDHRETASTLELRRKEFEEAQTLEEKAEAWTTATEAVQEAEAKLQAATEVRAETDESLTRATAHLDRLQKQRRDAYASVLADDLTDGDPCPVCGSPEHPSPAEGGHDVPGEDEIEAARTEKEQLRDALDEATAKVAEAEADLAATRTEVEGLEENYPKLSTLSPDEIETERAAAEEALHEAEQAAETVEEVDGQIDDHEQNLDDTEAMIEEHDEALDEIEGTIDRLESQAETIRDGLPDGVTSSDALAERRDEVDEELSDLEEALEDAEAALQAAKETVAEKSQSARDRQCRAQQAAETVGTAETRFHRALDDSDFPDASAFEEARLDEGDREALEAEIQAFEEEWAAATDRLERAEAAAEDVEAPDVEAAEETVDSVEAALNEQREAVTERTLELESIDEALTEIEEIREELAAADERFETIGFLADAARGNNDLRMSLQRFVLATRLEEVLRVANEHIAHMTQDRYRLLRAEEVRDRRRGAGLDLLVHDAYTGERRPVSTLSGGEGFMTALSLALGLSDVVQSVSGGRHLETLFIDEGFGSLDQEALDRAMEALAELRDTGRLVGVISHVSELKQRIATRLEVEPTQEGSTLSMTA